MTAETPDRTNRANRFLITLACTDAPGIVASVTAALFAIGANITESDQFSDAESGQFFIRIAFDLPPSGSDESLIAATLAPCVQRFAARLKLRAAAALPRIVILASGHEHALLHLLYQVRTGWLRCEVAAIIANHERIGVIAEREGVPFFYLPVTPETKPAQERAILERFESSSGDLLVLARYMQILSADFVQHLPGRIINIHHSFLPSFKGARPYHQAHARGVKIIGATAHYVTPNLDEGPIIEQGVERVTHAMSVEDFTALGRDIESRVLAKAVKLHLESRVMLHAGKTIVFG